MSELGRTTLTGLPYALDDVDDNSSVYSADYSSLSSTSTTGYRTGGPKEARLRRVALLSSQKDVEHLHAVKVEQIPTNKKIDKLGETLQQNFAREFGDVGDVYVPTNLKSMTAKHNFAVIRFRDEDAAKKALSASVKEIKGEKGEALPVIISPMNRQKTFYSNGTGYLGITNEAFDDGTRSFHSLPPCEQDIEISSCMAR